MTFGWSILLLLVPLIVIPVVLLFGYAGCDKVFGLDYIPPQPPSNVRAEGISVDSIRISWVSSGGYYSVFKILRITPGAQAEFETEEMEYVDSSNLQPNTEYTYQVLARSKNNPQEETPRSDSVTARTLDYMPTFNATLTADQTGIEGFCLVQRIEPVRLFRSGGKVRVVLQGSSSGNLLIDRVTISQVAPAGNVYDSAPDLVEIATAVSVLAGQSVTLPVISYALDRTKPLLIAFDMSGTPGLGNARFVNPVPVTDAAAHFRPATAEAGIADRLPSAANPGATPYGTSSSIFLVQRIDVG